jgi:hypothetical protein
MKISLNNIKLSQKPAIQSRNGSHKITESKNEIPRKRRVILLPYHYKYRHIL